MPRSSEDKTLTFRQTGNGGGGEPVGKVRLSTEPAERPHTVTRRDALQCARANDARFEEAPTNDH